LRRLLLRAAVITGGCFATFFIGLSISGPAHADDRPRLLPGLSDTIGGVLDEVLPDRPQRQPEEAKPEKAKPKEDKESRQDTDSRPHTPVRDVINKVKDEVEDALTTPAQGNKPASAEQPAPQSDTPDSDEPADTDPLPDIELPDLLTPTPVSNQTRQAPPAALGGAHESTLTLADDHLCGATPAGRSEPAHERHTIRIAVLRRATPTAPGYTQPAPVSPSEPDQDITPTMASPGRPYTGMHQDATITARATMPRANAVRVPGRDQAADSKIRRPDPPSG
jgi:hypothetical protein